MRRSWLFYGDSASSGAKVWVWDHVKEVALDREAKEVLEARRGGATRVPPLLSLVEELAANQRKAKLNTAGARAAGASARRKGRT